MAGAGVSQPQAGGSCVASPGLLEQWADPRGVAQRGLSGQVDRARLFSIKFKGSSLQINSPGGSPAQSSLIFKRIRAMALEKDVPVFAFAEDGSGVRGLHAGLCG